MFRMRRYRVVLLALAASVWLVWYVSRDAPWEPAWRPLAGGRGRGIFGSHGALGHSQADLENPEPGPAGPGAGFGAGVAGANPVDAGVLKELPLKDQAQDAADQGQAQTVPDKAPTQDSPPPAIAPDDVSKPVQPAPQLKMPTPAEDTAADAAAEPIPAAEAIPGAELTFNDISEGNGDDIDIYNPFATKTYAWTAAADRYPATSTIRLPTGTPKPVPKIQFAFKTDPQRVKNERIVIQRQIRDNMKKTWANYKKFAWMHDELRPVSGGSNEKFMGWAATLVDSLDTLWIMGLEREFEEAVAATAKIDFTKSTSNRIPLFETTIRYLGGLLGAYDVSGGKYPVLLDKATELGQVLLGAFDTKNRMPMLQYSWTAKHKQKRGPHAAVLAELGSLSVEFTRLAQLLGDDRYYDAVARITDQLHVLQNVTAIAGLWPLSVDASGCANMEVVDGLLVGIISRSTPAVAPDMLPGSPDSETRSGDDYRLRKRGLLAEPEPVKRQLADAQAGTDKKPATTWEEHCPYTGLAASSTYARYTLGGEADSTYEYLPKQYLLIGGHDEQYRDMYAAAADATEKYLLYRAMHPDEKRQLYFTGSYSAYSPVNITDGKVKGRFDPATGHLSCFVGGMYALGAKVFDRPADLDTAARLTDGCVWAYAATETGVMPEDLVPLPCESMQSCPWNETLWHEALDPLAATRDSTAAAYRAKAATRAEEKAATRILEKAAANPDDVVAQRAAAAVRGEQRTREAEAAKKAKAAAALEPKAVPAPEGSDAHGHSPFVSGFGSDFSDTAKAPAPKLARRQLDPAAPHVEESLVDATGDKGMADALAAWVADDAHDLGALNSIMDGDPEAETEDEGDEAGTGTGYFTPQRSPPTHLEYVTERIASEKLWPGLTRINSRKYLLRPEAIESVFYMYRITGEQEWRRKGLKMYYAVDRATSVEFGSSALLDVTSAQYKGHMDEMESFWPAETLKYFYLLFADPSDVSLDDYVLNTEAHPLLRPDAAIRLGRVKVPEPAAADAKPAKAPSAKDSAKAPVKGA